MADDSRELTVEYSLSAQADLAEIWDWNAKHYGTDHASAYIEFLRAETRELSRSETPGRLVHDGDSLRYSLIRQGKRDYGHLVIFDVSAERFRVFRYFHSSQDWQTELAQMRFS